MSFQITVSAQDAASLKVKLIELAGVLDRGAQVPVMRLPEEVVLASTPNGLSVVGVRTETLPNLEAKKRGRPAKVKDPLDMGDEVEDEKSAPVEAAATTAKTEVAKEEPKSNGKALTLEMVRAKADEVLKKKGLPFTRQLLAQLKVQQTSQLKPEQYTSAVELFSKHLK